MPKANRVFFVFPVFNESLNIPRVKEDLVKLESLVSDISSQTEFVFVDDGSTDDTAEQLKNPLRNNLKVLQHETNHGPGAAFQTAFNYLIERQVGAEDLVITLEGDATSDPTVFARMLKRAGEGDDIILASPYLYGGGFSGVESYRLLLSHLANFLFKLILDIHGIATFSCFFRIYRGQALLKFHALYGPKMISSQGFECAAEIILKAVRNGFSISEVPFRVDWSRRKGRSKMKIVKTSLAYFRLFFKFYSLRKDERVLT